MQYLFGSPNKSPDPKNRNKPKKEVHWRVQVGFGGVLKASGVAFSDFWMRGTDWYC